MKTQIPLKQTVAFEIPQDSSGDERREVFRKIQQNFSSDASFTEQHNTCASSEVDLRAVNFDVNDADLELRESQ